MCNGKTGKMDISTLLKNYSTKAKIPFRVNPHMLRHAFVTHCYYELGWTLKDIQNQTKHKSIDVLIQHYVDIDKVAYKKKYEEGFNKLSSDEELTHEEEDHTPQPKPEIKPEAKPQPKKKEVDNTSRYIALFRDGLIGKEEFFKLTTDTNHS